MHESKDHRAHDYEPAEHSIDALLPGAGATVALCIFLLLLLFLF